MNEWKKNDLGKKCNWQIIGALRLDWQWGCHPKKKLLELQKAKHREKLIHKLVQNQEPIQLNFLQLCMNLNQVSRIPITH